MTKAGFQFTLKDVLLLHRAVSLKVALPPAIATAHVSHASGPGSAPVPLVVRVLRLGPGSSPPRHRGGVVVAVVVVVAAVVITLMVVVVGSCGLLLSLYQQRLKAVLGRILEDGRSGGPLSDAGAGIINNY